MKDDLPYKSFPGWDDPFQYSPVCRSWYKSTEETPNQNLITEPYLFVNVPLIGASACAPISRDDYTDIMYGTSCLDIILTGDLNDYFDLGI